MSFVLMEDLKPYKAKRTHTIVYSLRLIRPLVKLARLTYRSSRLILRRCVWVIQKVTARQNKAEHTASQNQPSRESL